MKVGISLGTSMSMLLFTLTNMTQAKCHLSMTKPQVNVLRTIGPLVLIFIQKHRLWVLVRTTSSGRF